ncbi:uncharacterized protein LOC123685337 [Harmonia axyridis]|uniref:uncharacterized protein LOC123685337 n=1 Tax=Harmonia axyridis TaxID=115357 RepID=UPI001E2769F9|nr:uncharacterized protein LOC123685337 [Harmonia axyridis]
MPFHKKTILESKDGFVKYLGITVDRHMRWEYHCEQLAKKLRGLLHRFKRLKKQLNLKYLRMVYFGLVQSLLTYGISGWGAAYDVHIERLNIVQKCILKIICGHRMLFPSDGIYRVAHVLDLRQLYFMKIAALIKRRKIELRPIDHNYSTRHKLDHYKESKTTKTIGQRSCTYLAPKIYGTIPITLRALRNPWLSLNSISVVRLTEILAEQFEQHSSDSNYNSEFFLYKTQTESTEPLVINEIDNNPINLPIAMDELKYSIEAGKNSAPGPDQIPTVFLKHLPQSALQTLLNLFNNIWLGHCFVDKWREATVIPIQKSSINSTDPKNYRPISLTNTMCKVMERIKNKRLCNFLEVNELLTKQQSGFRKHRSTLDNLVQLQTEILDAFANKQELIAVFFDIVKAFDITWRHRILKTLKQWNIDGNMLHFIKEFISNRIFRVKIENTWSNVHNLQNGLPQGSILSPTLFQVAINDATHQIRAPITTTIYADDFLIMCRGRNPHTSSRLLQTSIKELEEWSKTSGFTFSPTKTKVMKFTKKHQKPCHLKLFNTSLQNVNHHKFLGMIFDTKLTWREHIKQLKTDCIKRLNIMKVLANNHWGADEKTLLIIYRTLIRSKLDYGCILYATACNSLLNSLNTIQNTALRLASGAYITSPSNSLCREMCEMPLYLRRQMLQLTYASRISADEHNPIQNQIYNEKYEQLYIDQNNLKSPICHQVNHVLTDSRLPHTLKHKLPSQPPWMHKKPDTNTTLTFYKKNDTHPLIIQEKFKELIAEHENKEITYTDASKSPEGVGCAFVSQIETRKFKLPIECSIFTAELLAILKALEYIDKQNNTHSVICTDSLSALQAIQDLYSKNSIVIQITDVIASLNDKHNSCYQGPRNRATKYKYYIKNKWKNIWQQQRTKLALIDPTISCLNPIVQHRRDLVTLRRLRIGHSQVSHQHLLAKENAPICTTCNTEITIQHIITECQMYKNQRTQFNVKDIIEEALKIDTPDSLNTLDLLNLLM